jgi:SAM-dependent methyltransferase
MFRVTDDEISDHLARYDPFTLIREPVEKRRLITELQRKGQHRAAAIVACLPAHIDDKLDEAAVDALYIRCHTEMQRLAEEFYHGHRILNTLRSLIMMLRRAGHTGTIRIVDVGTGLGYVPRWLALRGGLEDVEIIGVDMNAALIKAARNLAAAESAPCRFEHANAFRMPEKAHIYISTGVLHHFRGEALTSFFQSHDASETCCLAHWDFQPNILAPLGSWFFHQVRMRTPLARHDGTLSAVRAHSGETLVASASKALPDFHVEMKNRRLGATPIPRVCNALVAIRRNLLAADLLEIA